MTWGVILVMYYVETGCRVVSVGPPYDNLFGCKVRAEYAEIMHRNADYLSATCSLQRMA